MNNNQDAANTGPSLTDLKHAYEEACVNLQIAQTCRESMTNPPKNYLEPFERALNDAQNNIEHASLLGIGKVQQNMSDALKRSIDKMFRYVSNLTDVPPQQIDQVIISVTEVIGAKPSPEILAYIESYHERHDQEMADRKAKAAKTRAAKKRARNAPEDEDAQVAEDKRGAKEGDVLSLTLAEYDAMEEDAMENL